MRNVPYLLKTILIVFVIFITSFMYCENALAKISIVEELDDAGNQKFELCFHRKSDITNFIASLKKLRLIFFGYNKKYKGFELINMFELSLDELKSVFADCFSKNFCQSNHLLLLKLCEIFSAILLGNYIVNEESGMMIVNYDMLYTDFIDVIMRPFESILSDTTLGHIDVYIDWENHNLVFSY